MSVIEDVRQVFQDFLAPELRAITVRLDNLERHLDTFERSVESRLSNQDKLAEARHGENNAKFLALEQKLESRAQQLDTKIDRLTEALAVDRRLAKLEAQQPSIPQ